MEPLVLAFCVRTSFHDRTILWGKEEIVNSIVQLSYWVLVNSHPCLTRSKESQNNSHTNACLPTLINFHPCLTRNKLSINFHPCLTIRSNQSQNNFYTNSCLFLGITIRESNSHGTGWTTINKTSTVHPTFSATIDGNVLSLP